MADTVEMKQTKEESSQGEEKLTELKGEKDNEIKEIVTVEKID